MTTSRQIARQRIGRNITQRMAEIDVSLAELAKATKTSKKQLERIISGSSTFTISTLLRLCNALRVDTHDLLFLHKESHHQCPEDRR